MYLSQEAKNEINAEISNAIERKTADFMPKGTTDQIICQNKELLLGFLETLLAMLPGIIGKFASEAVMYAANKYLEKKCPAE